MLNGDYILVKAPSDYPGKKYRHKYIYEHHLIWWQNTKCLIPIDYYIHHKNHKKHDNRFENLELINKRTHGHLHHFKNRMTPLICEFCKKPFLRLPKHVNFKMKNGQTRFYCCRSHQVSYQKILKKVNSLVA